MLVSGEYVECDKCEAPMCEDNDWPEGSKFTVLGSEFTGYFVMPHKAGCPSAPKSALDE